MTNSCIRREECWYIKKIKYDACMILIYLSTHLSFYRSIKVRLTKYYRDFMFDYYNILKKFYVVIEIFNSALTTKIFRIRFSKRFHKFERINGILLFCKDIFVNCHVKSFFKHHLKHKKMH
jgi:hypothetical protein